MSMCAILPCGRRWGQRTSRRSSRSYWLSVLSVLVTSVLVVNSQYSSHCHFNQLCSCRVVPVKNGAKAASGYSHGTHRGTTPRSQSPGPAATYTGQFGIIIPQDEWVSSSSIKRLLFGRPAYVRKTDLFRCIQTLSKFSAHHQRPLGKQTDF